MEINQTTIINIATIAVVLGFGWYVKKNFAVVMGKVKENLFTCHGIVIAIVWGMLAMGATCTLMFVSVKSGNSVSVDLPDTDDFEEIVAPAKKGKKG